jgi:NADH-quinone oxidoreductase subunit A
MHPVLIAGYVALFVAIGVAFLAVNLIVGWLVRPREPNAEKLEVYECGEPTIGSSFVQFDLRFYVVALLFIIFDVEVALFFPWATVFGKATQLADPTLATVAADGSLTPAAYGLLRELGMAEPRVPAAEGPLFTPTLAEARAIEAARLEDAARLGGAAHLGDTGEGKTAEQALGEWTVAKAGRLLARTAAADMAAFYAILLVGFAYVWHRGDLDWVRATAAQRTGRPADGGNLRAGA